MSGGVVESDGIVLSGHELRRKRCKNGLLSSCPYPPPLPYENREIGAFLIHTNFLGGGYLGHRTKAVRDWDLCLDQSWTGPGPQSNWSMFWSTFTTCSTSVVVMLQSCHLWGVSMTSRVESLPLSPTSEVGGCELIQRGLRLPHLEDQSG